MASWLGDYRLLGLVGQGQFAQVYCAVHRGTGQLAAIKQSRHAPESASQEPFVLTELSHSSLVEGLVQCYEISQTPTGYQFVLEYCEGGTLRSHLTTNNPLPFHQTKSLTADILKGLSAIHQRGILHNDLKPENIFLSHASDATLTAKIGDFGSARFTEFPNRSRREIGSPTYAAPERFNGESSYASDLYAVGVMLYEMLLGDRPFSGTPEALRQAHQTQPVPFPNSLDYKTRKILETALHKQPHQRFQSAEALLAAIRHIQQPEQQRTISLPTVDVSQAIVSAPTHAANSTQRPLSVALPERQSKGVQAVELSRHYFLKIRTFQQQSQTHLECFTRRGQFIGKLSLNVAIAQAVLSYEPYQLITTTTDAKILLITLKPFQVRYLGTDIKAHCITAFPWGYIASDRQAAVVFDRSANAVSQLTGLPFVEAIAPLNNHTLLINDNKQTLLTVDLKSIDIGIIF